MNADNMLLADCSVLPAAITKTLRVKQLLNTGEETSVNAACKRENLSRSAFYKYRDHVFEYNGNAGTLVTLRAELYDRAGMLSRFMSVLYDSGANILTVNQNIPSGATATVSVSFRNGGLNITIAELIARLQSLDGVKSIEQISNE